MSFDMAGNDDRIEFSGLPVALSATDSWTMACWFWADDLSASFDDFMVFVGNGSAEKVGMSYGNVSSVNVPKIISNGKTPGTGSTTITQGVWHHMALTFTQDGASGSLEIFLDGGTEDIIVPSSAIIWASIDELWFGTDGANANDFHGKVAEAGVWSTILSDSQIVELATKYSPPMVSPQSLAFYAPLVNNYIDVVGGLIGTPVSSVSVFAHPAIIQTTSQILYFPPPAPVGGSVALETMRHIVNFNIGLKGNMQ